MGNLIAILVNGIPAIIGGFLALIGRKVGVAAASVAMFIIITAGLIVCINAILQSVLNLMAIPVWVSNSVGLFIPIDFAACLSAIVSSRVCRAAYDMAKFKIVAINGAS